MTDNTDLIARLRDYAKLGPTYGPDDLLVEAADALAARDAACGHQSNELVAKALHAESVHGPHRCCMSEDEHAGLRAATFQVTE